MMISASPVRSLSASPPINPLLTVHEILFLEFIRDIVKKAVEHYEIVYINANASMQRNFNIFVNAEQKRSGFTKEELNVDRIVSSIWSKAMENVVEGKKIRMEVDRLTCKLEPSRKGKFFTKLQIQYLINKIEKEKSNNSPGR